VGLVAIVGMLAAFGPASAAFATDDDPAGEDDFTGVIESLPVSGGLVGDWVVSGVKVHVTADTEIDDGLATIAVGASVEVHGTAGADGTFTATKIEGTEDADDDDFGEMHFEGFVEALPATTGLVGDWTVSGKRIHVTTATEIEQEDGLVVVGAAVEVEGLAEADGSITATQIEVKDAEDVDEDSASLTGTATTFPDGDHLGTWQVSNHDVRVGASTAIVHERRLSRGSFVRVFGTLRANGTIRASKVVVKS
jgi:Domain of unknown function (DUF5666)